MGLLDRVLGRDDGVAAALYASVVARAREAHWYEAGAVPDTVDGRFDMIAAVLAFVMLRLERDAAAAAGASARLAERFVSDMDGQLRELGVGDVGIGKHVGKMMGMLGGRLGAYRDGLADGTFDVALVRNLYRGVPPAPAAVAHVCDTLLRLRDALLATPTPALLGGALP